MTQQAKSKREVELELEVWTGRMSHIQTSVQALNVQGQLLKVQATECQGEIARLKAELAELNKPAESKSDAAPVAGESDGAGTSTS